MPGFGEHAGAGAARPALPLQGLILLAVEDSRFASDALRLMAQRSGARLRRAGTMAEAARHLARYRPDVVLLDMGLPDGPGTALIEALQSTATPDAPPVLAISGDPAAGAAALSAGAAGFAAKPFPGLAAFQEAVRRVVTAPAGPACAQPEADAAGSGVLWRLASSASDPGGALPRPDPLALREDLARAADLVRAGPDAAGRAYLARFMLGLARGAGDAALESAARALAEDRVEGVERIGRLISARLACAAQAFAVRES